MAKCSNVTEEKWIFKDGWTDLSFSLDTKVNQFALFVMNQYVWIQNIF